MDAGKTTLCRFLGQVLSEQYCTAVVDCDPGQSVIGPPACLGLGWEPWRGGEPVALRLVGASTPARHFLQTLSGIRRLGDLALALGAERLIFDASGYDDSPAGREFQHQVVDLLQPEHLVALQRSGEMEPLLASFTRRARPRIHRLAVSSAATARTPAARRRYREERFAAYLQRARSQELGVKDTGFHGMIPVLRDRRSYRKRLIGLCDERGFIMSIGILEELDVDAGRLRVYAPPFEHDRLASVQFGSLHLNRAGQELRPD